MASNPALTANAFQRGAAEATAAERVGFSATSVYFKTFLLLVILVLGAAFGWSQTEIVEIRGQQAALQPKWTWLAFLLTFILGIAGAFAFRAAAIIAPLYALAEGTLLGICSRYFALEYDGIVAQAVLATVGVFFITLVLYLTGIIKVTSRFVGGVIIAMGGLFILYGTVWLLSLIGVNFQFLYSPTPLGILLSLAIAILGALNLPIDFDFIRRASESGAPRFLEWYGAYGLLLSLIWMYVAILRLLAILRAGQR